MEKELGIFMVDRLLNLINLNDKEQWNMIVNHALSDKRENGEEDEDEDDYYCSCGSLDYKNNLEYIKNRETSVEETIDLMEWIQGLKKMFNQVASSKYETFISELVKLIATKQDYDACIIGELKSNINHRWSNYEELTENYKKLTKAYNDLHYEYKKLKAGQEKAEDASNSQIHGINLSREAEQKRD